MEPIPLPAEDLGPPPDKLLNVRAVNFHRHCIQLLHYVVVMTAEIVLSGCSAFRKVLITWWWKIGTKCE